MGGDQTDPQTNAPILARESRFAARGDRQTFFSFTVPRSAFVTFLLTLHSLYNCGIRSNVFRDTAGVTLNGEGNYNSMQLKVVA